MDDHARFRALAARLLRRGGFDVVGEAQDAAAGRRQQLALRPDVVLLDVMLPDRSGVDLARELLAGPDAPRVILTSSRDRADFGPGTSWPDGCAFIPKHELTAGLLSAALDAR